MQQPHRPTRLCNPSTHPSMAGKLDPVFIRLYNDNIANNPAEPIDLAKLRPTYSLLYSYSTADAPAVGRIYDDAIPLADGTPLPVRAYEPAASDGPWPVHLDFHGGGWALGDLDTEGHLCRHYGSKANVVVIDVSYRLVPEFPFFTADADPLRDEGEAYARRLVENGVDVSQGVHQPHDKGDSNRALASMTFYVLLEKKRGSPYQGKGIGKGQCTAAS